MTKEDAIYKMLSDSELGRAVGNRIYPLAAEEGTKFPYVIYSQARTTEPGTKDAEESTLSVAVSVVSKSYKEAHLYARLTLPAAHHGNSTTVQAGMHFPTFGSENEMYDYETGSFMVKTEILYDYSEE